MNALKNGLLFGSMFLVLVLVLLSPALAQAEGPGADAYTVTKGDCLWNIAARKDVFGDPWKWPLLFEANRGQISNPDLIQPGWSLKVMAAPSAAQIAEAKSFARHYKEGAAQAPPRQAPQAPAAAPPVAPQAAAPVPMAPVEEPQKSFALPLASMVLALALIAGLVYRKMKQRPEAEASMQAPAPVSAAAPVEKEEAPVIVAGPAEAVAPPKGPDQVPPMAEAELPAAAAPTESETALRADQGPDPLHPEDHKHAA